jgi:hypothetical protein
MMMIINGITLDIKILGFEGPGFVAEKEMHSQYS